MTLQNNCHITPDFYFVFPKSPRKEREKGTRRKSFKTQTEETDKPYFSGL